MKPFSIFILLFFICQLSFSQVQSDKPLISFTLSKYYPEVDYSLSSSSSGTTEAVRIFTGDEAKPFKDTLVQRHEDIDVRKTILELYRKALNRIPSNRIIYAKDISYVDSFDPKYMYNVSLSYSNLMGDYTQYYIDQLNSAFGLTTRSVPKMTQVLVLKRIVVNDSTVKYDMGLNNSNTLSIGTQVKIDLNSCRNPQLIKQLETIVRIPVFDEMSELMCLSIHLETNMESRDIDSWVEFFKKHGIILEKEMREVKFIEIIKKTQLI